MCMDFLNITFLISPPRVITARSHVQVNGFVYTIIQ